MNLKNLKPITVDIKPDKLTEIIREVQKQTSPYTATGEYLHYLCFCWGIDDNIIFSNSDEALRYILFDKISGVRELKAVKEKNKRICFLKQELKKRNAEIKRLKYENSDLQDLIKNNVIASKKTIAAGDYVPDEEIRLYFKDSDDIKPCDEFYVRNVYYQKDNSYAELIKIRKAD